MVRLDPASPPRPAIRQQRLFQPRPPLLHGREAVNRVGYDQIYQTRSPPPVASRCSCARWTPTAWMWTRCGKFHCLRFATEAPRPTRLGADRNIAYTIGLMHSHRDDGDRCLGHRQPTELAWPPRACPSRPANRRGRLGFHSASTSIAVGVQRAHEHLGGDRRWRRVDRSGHSPRGLTASSTV